jgi:hypothetical protein
MRVANAGKATALISVLISLVSFAGATPASAHNVLIASDPGVSGTETSIPEDVTLTFNDVILNSIPQANQIKVTDPMGMVISAGRPHVSGRVMSTVLSPKMIMDGKYKVVFRVVSADGHPVTGSYYFTVSNKATTPPGVKLITSGSRTVAVTLAGSNISGGKGLAGARGHGTFVANFSNKTLCYWISVPNVPSITAIHVHPYNTNLQPSDLIYVPVNLKSLKASRANPFCRAEDRATMTNLVKFPARFLLMVHTQKFPEGALSGQFK